MHSATKEMHTAPCGMQGETVVCIFGCKCRELELFSVLPAFEKHFCVCAVAIGKLQQLKKLDLSGSGMSNRNPLQQPGLVIT